MNCRGEELILNNPHALRRARRVGDFELESQSLATGHEQKVELGTAVRCPEVGVAVIHLSQQLLAGKALPRGAEFGVPLETCHIVDPQQKVQEPSGVNPVLHQTSAGPQAPDILTDLATRRCKRATA